MIRRHSRKLWAMTALAALAAGCADTSAQMMASRDEIHAALTAGADRDPTAAMHLRLARDQFHMAQQLLDVGDGRGADLKLQRAALDAQLARAMSRQVSVKTEANQTIDAIHNLQGMQQ